LPIFNPMAQINYIDHLEIDSEVRFGQPCVKGTRISVANVLGWLAAEMTIEEILEDFPQLKRADILACLAYSSLEN